MNLPDEYFYTVFPELSLIEFDNPKSISVISSQSFRIAVGTESFIFDTKEEFYKYPKQYSLSQNYPNPFNSTTKFRYSIPKRSFISLKIYDVLGREVSTLVEGVKDQGIHEVVFDTHKLASGLYIYRFQSENFTSIKKMLLIK